MSVIHTRKGPKLKLIDTAFPSFFIIVTFTNEFNIYNSLNSFTIYDEPAKEDRRN